MADLKKVRDLAPGTHIRRTIPTGDPDAADIVHEGWIIDTHVSGLIRVTAVEGSDVAAWVLKPDQIVEVIG